MKGKMVKDRRMGKTGWVLFDEGTLTGNISLDSS
jgi:hypothetical protein